MTTALYPGKFDPFHNGHLDVAHRAAAIFDRLVIAVYDAPAARALFAADVRARLIREAVADLAAVDVITYSGLTVACAREAGAQVIVRGLRNLSDYEYENRLGLANRAMAPDAELCLFLTAAEFAFLSATILKEVASLQGDIDAWAPPPSVAALRAAYAAAPTAKDGRRPRSRPI